METVETEELTEVEVKWDKLEGIVERGNTEVLDYELVWDEGNETKSEFEILAK